MSADSEAPTPRLSEEKAYEALSKLSEYGLLSILSEDRVRGIPAAIQYQRIPHNGIPSAEFVHEAIRTIMHREITCTDESADSLVTIWPTRSINSMMNERQDGNEEQSARDNSVVAEFQRRLEAHQIPVSHTVYLTPVAHQGDAPEAFKQACDYFSKRGHGFSVRQDSWSEYKPYLVEFKNPTLIGDTPASKKAYHEFVLQVGHYMNGLCAAPGESVCVSLGPILPEVHGLECEPMAFKHDTEKGTITFGSGAAVVSHIHVPPKHNPATFPAELKADPGYLFASALAQNGVNYPGSERLLPRSKGGN